MKKQFQFLALAAAVLALGACNNDDDMVVTGKQITVDASIGTMTRVTTTGNASSFEANDQISVFAWSDEQGGYFPLASEESRYRTEGSQTPPGSATTPQVICGLAIYNF